MVAVMMFAAMSSAGVVPTPLYLRAAGCGVGHWDHGRARRVCVGDSRREQPRVGAAGDRGSGMGPVAVMGGRARSAGVWDAGCDQSERLALRRLDDGGRSGRRGSSRLDVAAGAPLTPGLTAFLAALAALSFANIEACLTRPHAFALTVLLWHGGTVVIAAALFASIGLRCLRWPVLMVR